MRPPLIPLTKEEYYKRWDAFVAEHGRRPTPEEIDPRLAEIHRHIVNTRRMTLIAQLVALAFVLFVAILVLLHRVQH